MLIDICIGFNESCPAGRAGFVKKEIGMWEQLDKLLDSIEKNWDRDKLDYRIYVFYSEPLLGNHYEILKRRCSDLIFDDTDLVWGKNKGHIFKYNFSGDYTLALDTDIIVLRTPNFEFNKDVYASPGSLMNMKLDRWRALYEHFGIEYIEPSNNPINLNRLGKPFVSVGANDGCVLINNSIKKDFFNTLASQGKDVYKIANQRHFNVQISFSIAFKRFGYGYFNSKINYFPMEKAVSLDIEKEVEILHYLGSAYSDPEVKETVSRYGKK